MKRFPLFLLFLIAISFNSYAQLSKTTPFVDWTTQEAVQQVYKENVIYHDVDSGYTFIAGATYASGHYDLIVSKISSSGDIAWTKTYGSSNSADDAASGIAMDENRNIYVCGTVFIDSTNYNDFVLIKYKPGGSVDWTETYNGTGSLHDEALDIFYDQSSGTILVTGTGYNSNSDLDFITLQYDVSGSRQWDSYYDYNGDDDVSTDVLVSDNYVYVTGACKYQQWQWYTHIVQYDLTGSYVGYDEVTSGSITGDIVGDFFRDTLGNIYITGSRNDTTSYNYFTVKYDSVLNNKWSKTYNAPHGKDDYATGLWVDGGGNVYVTGAATDTVNGFDIHTIKYDSSGTVVWTKTWNDTTNNANDSAVAIIGDTAGYLYIVASTYRADNRDYLILKYDTAGNEQWNINYNGLSNGDDIPTGVAKEPGTEDIYVTGTAEGDTSLTYLTLRLKELDVILPQDTADTLFTWDYIANLGQLINTDTVVDTNVVYYNPNSYPVMCFQDDAFSYVWPKYDTSSSGNDSIHRIDLSFETESTLKARGYNEKEYYTNYYLGYSESRGKVPHYGNLLYEGVWSNIDIECGSDNYGFKYYINVKPSGSISSIQFTFSGQDTLLVDGSGNLLIVSAFDTLVQPKPAAWEIDNSGSKTNLGWTASYSVNSNIVTLSAGGSYNSSRTLVLAVGWESISGTSCQNASGNIDWSTFFGGNDSDWGLDVVTDDVNSSYFVGKTRSSELTFPVTTGANQAKFNGVQDGYLAKFDQYTVRKWTTYYGGSMYDAIQGVVYNSSATATNGEIYVVGTTESIDLTIEPQTNPNDGSYYKPALAGNKDAFIARFDKNGVLSWSSYIGGASDDEGRSITVDYNGDVYVGGNTSSTDTYANSCQATGSTGNQFPLCNPGSGAYYQSSNAGNDDIFITGFHLNNNLWWSTLYGSDADDKLYEIHFAKGPGDTGADYVYLAGKTAKTSPSSPSYGSSYDGSVPTNGEFPLCDISGTTDFFQAGSGGFVSQFKMGLGILNWATNMNYISSFQTLADSEYEFYVAGFSDGSTGTSSCSPQTGGYLPVCNANGGYNYTTSGDLYIAKFDKQQLDLKWSTLYPGTTDLLNNGTYQGGGVQGNPGLAHYDKILDATTDDADNLYIIGSVILSGFSTVSSTPSGMYYDNSYSGGYYNDLSDAFLLSFDPYNNRTWATYFGQDATSGADWNGHPAYVDVGAAITTYKTKDLYIAGYAGSFESCSQGFPYYDPGTQPTGTAFYFQRDNQNSNYRWDAFYSRFNLLSIGVGIEENKDENISLPGLNIYPNPAKGLINVYFEKDTKGTLNMYSYTGQLVKTLKVNARKGQTLQLATGDLVTGVYFLQLQTNNNTQTIKFIKQ